MLWSLLSTDSNNYQLSQPSIKSLAHPQTKCFWPKNTNTNQQRKKLQKYDFYSKNFRPSLVQHGQQDNNVYCARDVVMRPTGYKKLPDDLHLPDEEDLDSAGISPDRVLCHTSKIPPRQSTLPQQENTPQTEYSATVVKYPSDRALCHTSIKPVRQRTLPQK